MIPKGTCFCPTCESTFPVEEVLWHDLKNAFAIRVQDNTIAAAHNYDIKGIPADASVDLVRAPKKHGTTTEVTVQYRWGEKKQFTQTEHLSSRLCPRCYHSNAMAKHGIRTNLPSYMGLFDIYNIFQVGSPENGKSSWLSSVCTEVSAAKLSSMIDGDVMVIDAERFQEQHSPTQVSAIVRKAFLVSNEKRNPTGLLCVQDLAGEILLGKETDQVYVERAIRLLIDHADALFLFYDPRALGPSQETLPFLSDRKPVDGSISSLLSQIRIHTEEIPLQVNIMVRGDELQTAAARGIRMDRDCPIRPVPGLLGSDRAAQRARARVCPVVTAASPLFHEERGQTSSVLTRHMVLARDFLSRTCPEINTARAANFVVSNGQPVGIAGFDYTKAVCNTYPLAFAINALNLANLK